MTPERHGDVKIERNTIDRSSFNVGAPTPPIIPVDAFSKLITNETTV